MRPILAVIALSAAFVVGPAWASDDQIADFTMAGESEVDHEDPQPGVWSIKCFEDQRSAAPYCQMSYRTGFGGMVSHRLMNTYSDLKIQVEQGTTGLLIEKRLFPGSPIRAKVDGQPTVKVPSIGAFNIQDGPLLTQMKQGQELHVRWFGLPNKSLHEENIPLAGFEAALDVAEAVVQGRTFGVSGDSALDLAYQIGRSVGTVYGFFLDEKQDAGCTRERDEAKNRFDAEVKRLAASYRAQAGQGFLDALDARVEGISMPRLCPSYGQRVDQNMKALRLLP